MAPVDVIPTLGMHQGSTPQWSLRQAVEGYARHGIRTMTVRRNKLLECGVGEGARLLRGHGMRVTGYSISGPLNAVTRAEQRAQIDDNRRVLDEAAEIGARFVVVLSGGLPPGATDLSAARARFRDLLGELLPHARAAGVALGLEPLHPMLAAERSVLNTVAQANALIEEMGEGAGLVADVYHVWWDSDLEAGLRRAGSRGSLLGFHLSDWLVPTGHLEFDRGMLGDGVIDLRGIRRWMTEAGYAGADEIEIFSSGHWWKRDPDEFLALCRERYRSVVLGEN